MFVAKKSKTQKTVKRVVDRSPKSVIFESVSKYLKNNAPTI